ncbi:MAG: hypothetical protein AMXMBFR84_24950 [Candidatus Hydrogenedentota bacterium]
MKKHWLAVGLGLLVCTASFAIEPAYYGPKGNPEEPATRPYKAMWRGVKAFFYHPPKSTLDGHEKLPILGGAIELPRGVRRGTVELTESTWKGMAGSRMPDYKQQMYLNEVINADQRIHFLTDYVAAVGVIWIAGAAPAYRVFGAGVIEMAQMQLDYDAMGPEEQEALRANAWYNRDRLGLYNPDRNTPPKEEDPNLRVFDAKPKNGDLLEIHTMETQSENAFSEEFSGNMVRKQRKGKLAAEKAS